MESLGLILNTTTLHEHGGYTVERSEAVGRLEHFERLFCLLPFASCLI